MFDDLPETIEYTGEFGTELVLFLPFCNWLSKAGLLKNRTIRTYGGMRCFYSDLGCRAYEEKADARRFVIAEKRSAWLPVKNEHNFDMLGRPAFHYYPDLRSKFLKLDMSPQVGSAGRPLLIIHNKYNNEWHSGPINFISLETLDKIFLKLKHLYTIVYIRHGMSANPEGFSDDENKPHPFDDWGLLKTHPEVLCFDNLYAAHLAQGGHQDINTFKNVLYSRCFHFISSQGGGAHQIAFFSGSIMMILHRRGHEDKWAYRDGYYGFVARIPPILAICRNCDELTEAAAILVGAEVIEDRVLIAQENHPLVRRFSPSSFSGRQF